MSFYDNFVRLCAEKGVSPSKAALDCGVKKSNVTYWKNNRNNPSDVTLAKISEYFGISVEELKEEQKENPTKQTLGEVIPNYSDLSPDNQKKVRDFIDALLTVQQNQ